VGIPTFPARGLLQAGGLVLLLPQVTEYEVVAGGTEVALTALRATGTISRGPMASRPMPAGPDIPTPAAQCLGPLSFSYGLLSGGDPWAGLESFLAPVRAIPVHRGTDRSLPALQGGPEAPGPLVLSACRRLASGQLELRLLNPTVGEVPGPDGGRKVPGPAALRPWEIGTFRLP
jgi:alpha-mannosidase